MWEIGKHMVRRNCSPLSRSSTPGRVCGYYMVDAYESRCLLEMSITTVDDATIFGFSSGQGGWIEAKGGVPGFNLGNGVAVTRVRLQRLTARVGVGSPDYFCV